MGVQYSCESRQTLQLLVIQGKGFQRLLTSIIHATHFRSYKKVDIKR